MTQRVTQSRWSALLSRLRERGVLRVAASYLVIAWLLLQIGDVTLEPMGAPRWVMRTLIALSIAGFPIAILLAWVYELTPSGIERDAAPATTPRPAVGGLRRHADVAVIGMLALTVAYLLLKDTAWFADGAGLPEASVAILPFDNVSGEVSDEYLAEGFGDELRDQLSRVPSLKVISRSSSHAAENQSLPATRVAERLDVAALVEGTVRRDGKRLSVSAQLVDGRDGSVLWSSDYDRSTDDLLTVQAEIARAIVAAVLPQFVAQGGQIPATSTTVVSAQDLFLLGRHLEREETQEAFAKAQTLYEQAIAADPGYAAAHAALGRAIAFQNEELADRDPDALNRLVLPHLDRAIALDRGLSEAYMVKGELRRWTLQPGGDEFYRLAAELDPNNAEAQADLAAYERHQNRPDLSLAHALRARELDPWSFGLHWQVITRLMLLGRIKELPGAVARMTDLFGTEPRGAALACHAQATSGDHDAVLACLLLALRLFPEAEEITWLLPDACLNLGDHACKLAQLERVAGQGDESSVLWLKYERNQLAELRAVAREALTGPIDYGRGALLCEVLLASGLDEEALEVFDAAGIERGTTENAVLRATSMDLLLQILMLRQSRGQAVDIGRQLDALLEWSSRPLVHGGRVFRYHLQRAAVLTVAGRIDEAIAEVAAAGKGAEAPFDVRIVTDTPTGRVLQRDPRLAPILQAIRDRQAALRQRLPATLQAAGIDPSDAAQFGITVSAGEPVP